MVHAGYKNTIGNKTICQGIGTNTGLISPESLTAKTDDRRKNNKEQEVSIPLISDQGGHEPTGTNT